jgi:hypothetical protein
MELRFKMLALSRAKSRFKEPARFLALGANESVRLHFALAVCGHNDHNRFQEAPPTLTVNLIDPSSSGCSVTE